MRIDIRNMVCRHCVQALREILAELGVEPVEVGLGYALLSCDFLPDEVLAALDCRLAEEGFQRITDADDRVVQQVKDAVILHVRNEDECRLKLSVCVERHIGMAYESASRIFSAREGRTIEKYAIAMRVEWVKELLAYRQYSVAEIADRTGYSSAAHLSRQFKSVTGLTPTQFLESGTPRRSLADV